MFTGIIEQMGEVVAITPDNANLRFRIASPLAAALKIDQSLAHNGVCLTVVEVGEGYHEVTAVQETLNRSTLGEWRPGSRVNLERCMVANGRFDGHIVQGHVDQKGRIVSVTDQKGSWLIRVEYDATLGHVTVDKGSICMDGISLTCFDPAPNAFSLAIIPYTWENTNAHTWHAGGQVNLEFDIIGKYVSRLLKR